MRVVNLSKFFLFSMAIVWVSSVQAKSFEHTIESRKEFDSKKAAAVFGGGMLTWQLVTNGSQATEARFLRAAAGAAATLAIYSILEDSDFNLFSYQPTRNSNINVMPTGGIKLAIAF